MHNYVPPPLLYDGLLYYLKHSHGFLTCRDAKSGKVHYGSVRLPDIAGVFASPVGAAKRIYIPARNGRCVVIKHGPSFKVLAVNQLDDSFSASPVVVGNELYLRGERTLYCIAATRTE